MTLARHFSLSKSDHLDGNPAVRNTSSKTGRSIMTSRPQAMGFYGILQGGYDITVAHSTIQTSKIPRHNSHLIHLQTHE